MVVFILCYSIVFVFWMKLDDFAGNVHLNKLKKKDLN